MIKVAADSMYNRANLRIEIERLERPLADLRRLRDGGHPTAEEIGTAPRIDRWRFTGKQVRCLSGAAYATRGRACPTSCRRLRPSRGSSIGHGDTPLRSRASTASENLRLWHRPGGNELVME